jgi:hypothetical protein
MRVWQGQRDDGGEKMLNERDAVQIGILDSLVLERHESTKVVRMPQS